ncbi:MAG: hypothetical protein WCD08_07985 [Steroidobacteraceae bacterium]
MKSPFPRAGWRLGPGNSYEREVAHWTAPTPALGAQQLRRPTPAPHPPSTRATLRRHMAEMKMGKPA